MIFLKNMFTTKTDIIGETYRKYLLDRLLNDDVWVYLQSVVRQDLSENDESFAFTFYRNSLLNPEVERREPYDSLFLGLLSNLFDAFDLKEITRVIRIRAGMFLRKDKNYIHTPHVDYNFDDPIVGDHFNIVYYFNTTDAPSYLYEETQKDFIEQEEFRKDPHIFASNYKFTVRDKSQCIENTAVMFDGKYYHSSSSPTDTQYRISLNINGTLE